MVLRSLLIAALFLPAGALAQGVTDDTIVLGQPAAFSGPSAVLGNELWRGMQARLREINDAGGVHGRKVIVELCDDQYDPEQAARCVYELVAKRNVFMLVNTVGTPTIVRVLPLLQVWARQNVFIFGNFTGARPQRTLPAARYVFNVRASHARETELHVKTCVEAGRQRIGTFIQNDAFGKDGEEGVRAATQTAGAFFVVSTSYERGAATTTDMSAHVRILREAGVDCVSTAGSYQAVAAFVRAARAQGWRVPIFALSFTGAEPLLAELGTGVSTDRIIMTQVVPHPDDTRFALVREYRAAMDKYKPSAPSGMGNYAPASMYTFGSLEGYLNTKILMNVFAKTNDPLTREAFKRTAESVTDMDVGLGKDERVTFGPVFGPSDVDNHQALDSVWLTVTNGGSWKAVENPAMLAKQLVGE